MSTKYIEFKGISKVFPGVKALDDISFRAEGGRVTALLGENGAGKSTLLKILSGDIQPTERTVTLNGEEKRFHSPQDSLKSGISVIYQERQLVPMLSVEENIFLDALPKKGPVFMDKKKLRREAETMIERFGLPISATTPVAKLPVAYQQMVEIMKSVRRDTDVIAFDEPTAPLADAEITVLFRIIEELKAQGISSRVVNLRFLKPICREAVLSAAEHSSLVVTLEDGLLRGGIGEQAIALIAEDADAKRRPRSLSFGVKDRFVPQGTVSELKQYCGMDTETIVREVSAALASESIREREC